MCDLQRGHDAHLGLFATPPFVSEEADLVAAIVTAKVQEVGLAADFDGHEPTSSVVLAVTNVPAVFAEYI